MTRCGRTALLVALVSCAGACAGAPGAAPPLVIHNSVSVVIRPSPRELPFDPADARLAAATVQLSAIARHPVSFEFDVALLPDWRPAFQQVLIESVESVARDLDVLAREQPRVWAHGAPLLERVVSRYDAVVARATEWTFDAAAHALTLSGPATFHGVERGFVQAALEDEYSRWVAERWGQARPGDVPPAEQSAYFEFLTDSRVRAGWSRRHANQGDGAPPVPDADALLGVVALASLANLTPATLAHDVRAWLVRQAPELAEAYYHSEDRVAALPPGAPWHRAEAAWVAWANAQLPGMNDEEKTVLASSVFVRMRGPDGVLRTLPLAFPGFDRFAFGVGVADAWARAGHPRRGRLTPAQRALLDAVLCPVDTDPDGVVVDDSRCEYGWYADATDDPRTTRRLVEALLARKDPDLVRSAVFAMASMPREGDRLASLFVLLDALDPDDGAWSVAFRVVADRYAEGGEADRWSDLARRVWRAHPARRGALLYALVQVDRYGDRDKVGWASFAETFGAPIGATELGALLDQGARGWSLAATVWPALSAGWSRADVLRSRLDAYLARTDLARYDPHDPAHALGAVARRLCETGDVGAMAQLAAYFRGRLATHPGESYAATFEDTGDCAKPARSALKPPASTRPGQRPLSVPSP